MSRRTMAEQLERWAARATPGRSEVRTPPHWFTGDHWPLGLLSISDDTQWLVTYQTGHALYLQRMRNDRAPCRRHPLD